MLREIETFVAVCSRGTFTEAGRRLGLTQSAISDQMRRLELFLGRRLFDRTGRSATLNATGKDLLPLAEQVLQLVREMRSNAGSSCIEESVRVGTVGSMHNGLVLRTMMAFRTAHPGVPVQMSRGESSDLLGQVEREELDIAVVVRLSSPLPNDIEWLPLLRKPFVLLAPVSVVATDWQDALTRLPLLRYAQSSTSGKQIDRFLSRTGAVLSESIPMKNFDTMISLVSRGLGVALVPACELGEAQDKVCVYDLGGDVFYREVGMLRRRGLETPIINGFLAALKDEAVREPFSDVFMRV